MYKLKIFISSSVDEGSDNIFSKLRKKLKRDLEKIELFNVYIYEKGYGTSKNVVDDYLDEIYDSHLCLFLINSAEGTPDGVKKEIDYAAKYKKPQIYIFNHENTMQETPLEKELKTSDGSRIKIINSFHDYYDESIDSVKSEIVKMYKDYSHGRLIRNQEEKQSSIELKLALTETKLEKSYINGFNETKKHICAFMGTKSINFEEMTSNNLDQHTIKFFDVLVRNRDIEEFNTTFYLDELKKWHSEEVFEVVRIRWKAIEYYYSGRLEKCIENLNIAYEKAKGNKIAPWLIQDILIDLRNKNYLSNNNKNKIDPKSTSQKLLTQTKEILTYPVIDRLSKQLVERMEIKRKDTLFQKPHSTTYDNILAEYAEMLTSIYIVAAHYGSLTHLELIINYLKEIYFHLVEIYSDWEFKVMLLKTTAYLTNKKDLEKILREYNNIYTKISSNDVEEILSFVNKHPNFITSKKNNLLILSHMGYYLNDDSYKKYVEHIEQDFNSWLEDTNKNVLLGNYYFKFAKDNIERLNPTKVVQYANAIYSTSLRRFYDESLEVLKRVNYKLVETEELTNLIYNLKIAAENQSLHRYDYLRVVLTKFHQITTEKQLIDDIANKFLPEIEIEFYNNGIFKHKADPYKLLIESIESLEQSNAQSTVGEIYTISGYDYFSIIKTILLQLKDLPLKDIKRLLDLLFQIIIHENQEPDAKVSAFQLLIYLKNNDERFLSQEYYCEDILKNDQKVLNTRDSFMFNHSSLVINFNYYLFKSMFNKGHNHSEHYFIGEIISASETERLDISKAIRIYVYGNKSEMNDFIISLLFILKADKNEQIRANSVLALIYFIKNHGNSNENILIEISKMMDSETTLIKSIILRNINAIKEKKLEIAKYILQKGRIDDHYIIRKQTNSIIETFTEVI